MTRYSTLAYKCVSEEDAPGRGELDLEVEVDEEDVESSDELSSTGGDGDRSWVSCRGHDALRSYRFWISLSFAYGCSPLLRQVCDKIANFVFFGSRSTNAPVRVLRNRMSFA